MRPVMVAFFFLSGMRRFAVVHKLLVFSKMQKGDAPVVGNRLSVTCWVIVFCAPRECLVVEYSLVELQDLGNVSFCSVFYSNYFISVFAYLLQV